MVIIAKNSTDNPKYLLVDASNNLQTAVQSIKAGSTTIGKVDVNAPTNVYNGQTSVTTAGTQVILASSQAVLSVSIKANDDNTGSIFVGDSNVSSTTGIILDPGDSIPLDIANLATVWIDSAVNGEGVSYIAVG